MKIGILDYNACNISSIYYSIYRLGYDPIIVKNPKDLKKIDKLIVPGVGAAKSCIEYIKFKGIFDGVNLFLEKEKPILGICLGLQIFCKNLYEHGNSTGFGLIDADVIPFKNPNLFNIGWSKLNLKKKNSFTENLLNKEIFYFCHSYYLKFNIKKEEQFCLGSIKYENKIPSLIVKKNFIGAQFHPEKSQKNGINLLKTFINWTP